ncbi:MAG: hypothetical protein AB1437_00045 [Pseudomonadota bacterium]
MTRNRLEAFDRDAAVRAQQRLERRSRRRLVKHMVERNAQWRRLAARAMAAGLAAMVATHLLVSEAAADAPAPRAQAGVLEQA